ncbi:MAG: glycosyltransferase [Bacteroidales bacterium]
METSPGIRKKIFVLLSRVPWPLEKGDKLRAFYQLRELSENHDIILCALNQGTVHPDAHAALKPFVRHLYFIPLKKYGIINRLTFNWFGTLPFQVAYFFDDKIRQKIQGLLKEHQPDHIYCQLIRMAHYLKDVKTDKTIDYQDVFSKGLKRRMEIAPWYLKPVLNIEYQRVMKYEARVFDFFDKKTIISLPDREAIGHPRKEEIVIIPNGVDTTFFQPLNTEKTFDLIFSGNMGYPPNINAARYLVKQIMPLVWQHDPGISLVLAGTNPSPAVKALAGERVRITGWVNDMRHYYGRARIFVAPMQIGTGLQNKVLEAMAMKLPCITSPLANQALGAQEGKDILIGNNPENYAKQIVTLLNDPEKYNTLATNGYQFIQRHFNWKKICQKLESVIVQNNRT